MKLNKLERYTAYVLMLTELENSKGFWLCWIFERICGIELDNDFRFSNMKRILPELWRKRNKGRCEESICLWNSKEQRIAALKKCIEETHP